MKRLLSVIPVMFLYNVLAQDATQWPVELNATENMIKVYKPLPESMSSNVLSARAVISILSKKSSQPEHGIIQLRARIEKDAEAKIVLIQDTLLGEVQVAEMRDDLLHQLKVALAREANNWVWAMSEDEFNAMLLLGSNEESTTKQESQKEESVELKVEYDGVPLFVPIDQTTLRYAENSGFQVIYDGSKYYCADRGIWFVADHPEGPWSNARKVPEEMQHIPDSSPVQNIRFLHISDLPDGTNGYVFYPGYLNAPPCWDRLHTWTVDYEGQGNTIKIRPYHIEYRETSENAPIRKTKKWGRDPVKFPETKK